MASQQGAVGDSSSKRSLYSFFFAKTTPMIKGRPPTLHNLSISNSVNLHSLDNDFHFLDNDFHFLDSVCSCSGKSGAAICALMSTRPSSAAPPSISQTANAREDRVQKLTTGFYRWNWASIATRAACVIGIPGGFCGIRRRGPGRYSDRLSAGRPPTFFRQPTVSVSSFSHHQPAVMAITK
jgi:hypothetical protein